MKKVNLIKVIVASVLMCLTFSFNVSAKKLIIHKSMSADGIRYDKVNETHTLFKDELDCHGRGNIVCGWVKPPKIGDGSITVNDVETYVQRAIDSGNNNGSTLYNNKVYIKWSYDSKTDDLLIVVNDK